MAEHPGFDRNAVGEMDYPEHERTYARFLWLVKYGTIGVVGILVFMLVALIANGGFIGGIVTAAIFIAVASFVMRTGETHSMKH
ncbi:aa3-type cytochrome c oxidase subunit IV [Aureimonas psammosilenae]|uniref:aa3-type cytochrome c oxidase subunit IV n=1 Tax=Aureimonas psammosilenae TaxID=2495496 RepID=UPI001261209B|nr:aa3-type cytochrome c oxidase subunit IV [Aureimonas psammosilenae]